MDFYTTFYCPVCYYSIMPGNYINVNGEYFKIYFCYNCGYQNKEKITNKEEIESVKKYIEEKRCKKKT